MRQEGCDRVENRIEIDLSHEAIFDTKLVAAQPPPGFLLFVHNFKEPPFHTKRSRQIRDGS